MMAFRTLRSVLVLALFAGAGCTDSPTPPVGTVSAQLTASPATLAQTDPLQLHLSVTNGTTSDVEFFVTEYNVFRLGQTTPLITRPVDGETWEDEVQLAAGATVQGDAGVVLLDDRFTPGRYEIWVTFSGVDISARAGFEVE